MNASARDGHVREASAARVHAVIVHHRGEQMLQRCLASLLESEGVALEVVLVSNHCLEPLPPIVDEESRVHLVISEISLGFSAANNLGVDWARQNLGEADYYYFLNNDTESRPDSLRLLVAALEEDSGAALVGPQLLILDALDYLNSLGLQVTEDAWGWDEGIGQRLDEYRADHDGALPPRREMLALTGSALLAESTTFLAIDGWTELYDYYFEDIDLSIKVWEAGRRVIHAPEAVVHHQISATMTEDEAGTARKHFFFWRNRLLLALARWPSGLLWRLFWRAAWTEVKERGWRGSALQRQALAGALARLPRAFGERFKRRRSYAWRTFLHPPGSVPVITLPRVGDSDVEGSAAEGGEADETVPKVPVETWSRAAVWRQEKRGKRVLIFGCAPLPFEEGKMNYAPGWRTWQFARPLAAAGHTVCVAALRIPGAAAQGLPAVEEVERDGVLVFTMEPEFFESPEVLPGLADTFAPEVIVGATALPSRRAAELAGERPLWVDLYGDPMAEAQARASVTGLDDMSAYVDLLDALLGRGDVFSVVSDRQRCAAIGQLGFAGRLNRLTNGHELVHVVPCGVESEASQPEVQRRAGDDPELAEGDFVVLWSGGFNTWCDVETLFAALELAMAEEETIRFVATGGAIAGHDEQTYTKFEALVEGSPRRRRYLLKGLLPSAEARRYLARADLGLVTEKAVYERELGSSGRLAHWLGVGLPFIASDLSELGRQAAAAGAARLYPPDDAPALARQIATAAADRRGWRKRREAALGVAAGLSFERTAEPLCAWVRGARRAADHTAEVRFGALGPSRAAILESRQRELEARLHEIEEELHLARHELGEIHRSKMWRLWMASLAARRALLYPLRLFGKR